MKIFLVRHGITESNKQKRYVGWTDVELSPEGCAQAEALAPGLSSRQITGLYSSDLRRAAKTAEILGTRCGIKPVTTPLLREMNFGEWEGLCYEEILSAYEKELRLWYDDPFHRSPPGGEDLRGVCQRTRAFLEELWLREDRNGNFVVVSHGGAICSIIHHYLGLKQERFWELTVDNASVSLLEKDADYVQVSYVNKRCVEGGC
jgi:alpha-ribazole phosphatase